MFLLENKRIYIKQLLSPSIFPLQVRLKTEKNKAPHSYGADTV